MNVKVAAAKGSSTTEQGNLLESLSEMFLKSRGYEVTDNVQNTGVELDLLCVNKTNRARTVYVECKAYDYKTTIKSDVLLKLKGIKDLKGYDEAWLVTTAPFGKQAKGLEIEIADQPNAADYSFYTPEKLINVLVDSKMIVEYSFGKKELLSLVGDEKKLGDHLLLVTPYGNFWATHYIISGEPSGIIYTNANDGEIVYDDILLGKLQDINSGLDEYDSSIIIELLQSTQEQIQDSALRKMRLNPDYLEGILDLGVKINHPHTSDFTLEDIYIFPDLEINGVKKRKKLNTQSLLGNTGRNQYIISGDELSGKTTLGRLLQWRKSIQGKITLTLNGSDIQNTSPSSIDNYIEKCFYRQYGSSSEHKDVYKKLQSDKSSINIVLDDFNRTSVKRPVNRAHILNKLNEDYGDIYLLINSDYEIESMARSETKDALLGYTEARLLQLGHVKRDELVTKWLQAGEDESESENEVLGLKTEILKKIEVAVGENFIPTHPFHLLTMLHIFEAGTKARTQGNSYADLYHYFILQALVDAKVKSEDLHFYLSYMSYLAYTYFTKDMLSFSHADISESFEQFSLDMDIDKDFDTVHKTILKAKILQLDEDGFYSFHLSYSRYYFVARFLANNIDEEEIKLKISELIGSLHQTDASNIVIFLVHHSKNKAIIQAIVNQAKALFAEMKMQSLTKGELEKVNSLIKEEMKFILADGTPQENRRRELERRDEYEERKDNEGGQGDILDVFAQVNLAFKTIDVLGQIANNYYGDLDAKSKTEILTELYTLGLRGLSGFMQSFDDYTESLTQ